MATFFDPDRGSLIQGKFLRFDVLDPAASPNVPNYVIDETKPFQIALEWELRGTDVPMWLAQCNDPWYVKVYAEALGPGADLFLKQDTVSKGGPIFSNTVSYSHIVTIPAGAGTPGPLQEEDPGSPNSGIYRLMATVFLDSSQGAPGFDISGFMEGPVIRVENPI